MGVTIFTLQRSRAKELLQGAEKTRFHRRGCQQQAPLRRRRGASIDDAMRVGYLAALVAVVALGQDSSKSHVQIDIRDYGSVVVELEDRMVATTVENFLSYVDEEYYDEFGERILFTEEHDLEEDFEFSDAGCHDEEEKRRRRDIPVRLDPAIRYMEEETAIGFMG